MKWVVLTLLLAALASGAHCVDDQAFLGIFAETSVQKMAGMPEMKMPKLPPGMDLSKMPGMEAMMGAPKRSLTVRLWSPGIAPENAFAYVASPDGLKVGKRMDLDLYRPKPQQGTGSVGGEGAPAEAGVTDFTIKIYWGSSATVKPGQPKIIKWEGLSGEQRQTMRAQAREARKAAEGMSYFYKPDWTTGYWPTPKQPGKIEPDASLVGNYALTTNYTGNVAIDCPSNVDFLAAIEFTSPDIHQPIPLENAIAFGWNQIPNALGLHASIFGMEGKSTLVVWISSEVYNDMAMGNWDYLQMAQVRQFVNSRVMMQGDATGVTVPAGIFKDCDMATLRMIGYGPGAALDKGQPLPRIQTKTTLMMPLGGKMMKKMGGRGMMPDVGAEETPDTEDQGQPEVGQ